MRFRRRTAERFAHDQIAHRVAQGITIRGLAYYINMFAGLRLRECIPSIIRAGQCRTAFSRAMGTGHGCQILMDDPLERNLSYEAGQQPGRKRRGTDGSNDRTEGSQRGTFANGRTGVLERLGAMRAIGRMHYSHAKSGPSRCTDVHRIFENSFFDEWVRCR